MTTTPPNGEPYTKPQPVVLFGAITAGVAMFVSLATVLVKDNATAVLALGLVGAAAAGAQVVKDQIVKGQVVPYGDVASYRNTAGDVVQGPALNVAADQLLKPVDLDDSDLEPADAVLEVDGHFAPEAYEGEHADPEDVPDVATLDEVNGVESGESQR